MSQTTSEYVVPARATRREWVGLAVLTLAALVYAMDLTVLNLAIPRISAELRPTSAQLLWIIDIYGFLVAGLLITMGTLGDRIGRRKLLLGGAAGFALASLLAAFSTSSGDAHREPGHHGHRRSDGGPLDAVADLHHVPGPEAAHDRDRVLDRRLFRRRRHRTGPRRRAPGVLLVGLGVPDRRPGDGTPADPRPAHAARVQGPRSSPPGPAQRRDVAARDPGRRLRAEGDRAGWDRDGAGPLDRRRHRASGSCSCVASCTSSRRSSTCASSGSVRSPPRSARISSASSSSSATSSSSRSTCSSSWGCLRSRRRSGRFRRRSASSSARSPRRRSSIASARR